MLEKRVPWLAMFAVGGPEAPRHPAAGKPRIPWLALLALAARTIGAGQIENIPADWRAVDRQRLEIVAAEASASLGDPYTPQRIHDGRRETKWVSPTQTSPAAPQWVTLSLASGVQEVSAVAVFGEAINNDGILDAEIQLEAEGSFRKVASVSGATSGSWLAAFEPVRTGKVRLLITRSGGPSDHTDVWEMEVYGRPLSAGEMRAYLVARLEAAEAGSDAAMKSLQTIGPPADDLPKFVREAAGRLQASVAELRRQSERWDQMEGGARGVLIRQADQTAALAARWRERSGRFQGMARSRKSALAKAREEQSGLVKEARQAGMTIADVRTEQATLANDRLFVSVDLRTGAWNAFWAEGADIAIFGAQFSVETSQSNIVWNGGTASVNPVQDALGKGRELRQVWQAGGARVERELRLYDGLGVFTLGGRIVNESDAEIRLGTAKLIDVSDSGWWWLGQAWELPAAVYIQNHSLLRSVPFASPAGLDSPAQRSYHSSGVLMLTSRDPAAALTIGYVRADEASPDVAAKFRLDQGGVSLAANSRFLGRVLGPRETVELNRLYLAGGADPFQSLEDYGDAVAKFNRQPARTGPTSLWCSWYAHRMGMTEEKVLANAEVAAKHFKPLGLEIMQLDHGWQRGDVTGDWVPNERFPHGLKWLADQLRKRHGLRLGVWISPTDVAETSEVFKQHPDWLLKGDDGKPRVNWRWYWTPNPNCYELDATHPGAFQFIENSFRQLTQWGVSYYKIDFIAAAAGEHFIPHDPKTARGWPVLRRAMEAVRCGAGDAAWIRYCQTPPLLSAGLADSAYGGNDTLDAGIPGRFDVLRDNAHALAAGYWLNDRPYHREVCDMSVRRQGSVEETRVRAAIMTLANCSISWSDELCYLPPSRIRLMQQCLPPGNPPMKPLDLFQRDVPSVWHIRVKSEVETWEVVGLFNFNNVAESRTVRFDQLGLEPGSDCAVFEFWEEKFLGLHKGGIEVLLPPESSRILSIRKVTGVPQLVGTDMHLLQGCHEIKKLAWDADKGLLSGSYRRMPGLEGKAFFYLPEGYYPKFDFPLSPNSARLTHVEGPIWVQEIEFAQVDFIWSIPIEAPKKPPGKEPNG